MGLVNSSVPGLFGGVSQQAAQLRNPSKWTSNVNAYPSIANGLGRRPPTTHKAKLSGTPLGTSDHIHWINRDAAEQYAVRITSSGISVWRLSDGAAMTVNAPSGYGYLSAASNPQQDIACLTVADYTFIVNRKVNTAMDAATVGGALTGTVQRFADLPGAPAVGNIYQIVGDNTNSFDDYYVIRTAANVWAETRAPGSDKYKFDPATMPHTLVRTGPTTFTFGPATWAERLVGSEASNPNPSFIGRPIQDVFFFRNRLGFASGESVILSRAGLFFEFYAKSSTQVLDDDPIDRDADTTEVVSFKHAAAFNSELVLFTTQGMQFRLVAGDVLTPKTARLVPVTRFEAASGARPVTLGPDLYFGVDRGTYSGIREYYVEDSGLSNDAADITAEVPRYIPAGAFKLAGTTGEDVLAVLTETGRQALYVYKFLWVERKKVQSAWFNWTLPAGDTILSMEFYGVVLHLLVNRSDGVYLDLLSLKPGEEDGVDAGGRTFLIHLDRKTTLTGVYNSGTGLTTWTLPYTATAPCQIIMTASGWGSRRGTKVPNVTTGTTTLTAPGDYSAAACVVGQTALWTCRLSPQYLRDRNGLPRTDMRLQLKRMRIVYDRSGPFSVAITPQSGTARTYRFTGKVLGSPSFLLGRAPIDSGVFQVLVSARNDAVEIDISTDSYLPVFLQSIEWDAEYNPIAQRT